MLRKRFARAFRLVVPGVSCLVAVISPASADRASLTLEQSVIGQTNVFRTSDDEKSDGAYEVRPRLRFERPAGDRQYSIEYSPTYDTYFHTDGIDGLDQYGRARAAYSPWATGTVSAHTDLAYYRSIRSDTVTGPTGAPELNPNVSGRVFRALSDLGYEHRLTPITTATAEIHFASYQYSTSDNADSIGGGGELDVVRELTRTLAAGVFGAASHRRFDERSELQPKSHNTVLQVGPVIRFSPTPTLRFEGQAGPAWLYIDRDAVGNLIVPSFRTVSTAGAIDAAVFRDCGVFAGQPLLVQCPLEPAFFLGDFLASQTTAVEYPGSADSVDEDELDGFARLRLIDTEEWGNATLEYFRGEDASSGGGGTSIRDSVTAAVELVAGENWSFRLRGNWNQRETLERFNRTEVVAGPSTVLGFSGSFFAQAQGLVVVDRSRRKTTQYWADARLSRQITPALSADLAVRYLNQDESDSFSDEDDYEDWKGIFTLRYELPSLDY